MDDQGESDEADKDPVEFFEASVDAPEALQPAKQAFHFIVATVFLKPPCHWGVLGKPAPCASVLGNIQNRVEHREIVH